MLLAAVSTSSPPRMAIGSRPILYMRWIADLVESLVTLQSKSQQIPVVSILHETQRRTGQRGQRGDQGNKRDQADEPRIGMDSCFHPPHP